MRGALRELAALADGVQLTPGNHPTPGFEEDIVGITTRTHHGFAFGKRREEVWSADGRCLVASDSVHPPARGVAWNMTTDGPAFETMYPGHELGDGEAIEEAMRREVPLAVDVSHVFIQRTAGVIGDATWSRLMDYPRIAEVHVSANDGRRDLHWPITATTFGLDWARARGRSGAVIVLECMMHAMELDDRKRQVELVRRTS